MKKKTVSVIIPFYNEHENIPALYERLTRAAEAWEEDYEVVAVDDGSSDNTLALLTDLRRRDPRWRVLSFSRNFGHQVAVSAGLHYAGGDAVVVMDSDLQDPPEVIGRLLATWRSGYHVAYAVRRRRKEFIGLRVCYFLFYRLLAAMTPIKIPLDSGDFCVMDRIVVDVLRAMPEQCRFVRGMRSWAGFRQTGVDYERDERASGRPKYSVRRLLGLALDGMISLSYAPLRLVSLIGMVVSVLSLVAILFLVIDYFYPIRLFGYYIGQIPGRASLAAAILFMGGVQMMCVGIIGEYVGRVFEESKRRPRWVIQHAAGVEPPENIREGGWFVRAAEGTGRAGEPPA